MSKNKNPSGLPFKNFAKVILRAKPIDFLPYVYNNEGNHFLYTTEPKLPLPNGEERPLKLVNSVRHPDNKRIYAILDENELITCMASTMMTTGIVDENDCVTMLNISTRLEAQGQGQMKALIYNILKDVSENGMTFKVLTRLNEGHAILAAQLPLIHRHIPDAPIDYDNQSLTDAHKPYILELNEYGTYSAKPAESWDAAIEHTKALKENSTPEPAETTPHPLQTPQQ